MSNAYRSTLAGGGSAPVGDATAADVLTGKTFSGAVGSGVAGTMPNQGAVSGTATPSQPYTIPAGYHNGSGVVTADSTAKFSIQYYNATPLSTYGYQYITKAFLDANGYSKVKVTTTGGSAYVNNNNSLGGTPTGIGTVHAGNSEEFALSLVTDTYLMISANQTALFEFE